VGWAKCSGCGFNEYCWQRALDSHDPAVVPGVTQSLRHVLRERGVTRYDDLARMSVVELADLRIPWGDGERRVGDRMAERVLRQVRVLISGEIEVTGPPETPPSGPVVYFDIESNPWDIGLETKVYLWGMLIDRADGGPPEYWGAVAGAGVEGDEQAWLGFLAKCSELLQAFGEIPFVHYSHYEKTWVKQYADRFGDPEGTAARVLSLLWDMEKRSIRGHLCLPVHSYGLKQVEKQARFERSQQDYGALWSVARYNAYLGAEDEDERDAIEEELRTYNREDCVAMREVLRWVSGL
jgi:predicted RecB family nuclease